MFQPQQPYPGWGAPPMWQQNQLNQLYMQQLCGVVRYPNATTYSAGSNPYCNAGCCGGF